MPNDVETLTALNHDYVMSVRDADTKTFDKILAPDFLCSNPDASLLERAQLITLIGKGARITELRRAAVKARRMGPDSAIIHARIRYKNKAGIERVGRYTDDWARRDGKWLCVSARRGNSWPPARGKFAGRRLTTLIRHKTSHLIGEMRAARGLWRSKRISPHYKARGGIAEQLSLRSHKIT